MRNVLVLLLFLLIWLPLSVCAGDQVALMGMTAQPSAFSSHFVFVFNKKPHGRVRYLSHPHRVILELASTNMNFDMRHVRLAHSNIRSVDTQEVSNGLLFIFTTKEKAKWNIQVLPEDDENKIRLQLAITSLRYFKQSAKRRHHSPFLACHGRSTCVSHALLEDITDASHEGMPSEKKKSSDEDSTQLKTVFQHDLADELADPNEVIDHTAPQQQLSDNHPIKQSAFSSHPYLLACNGSAAECLSEAILHDTAIFQPDKFHSSPHSRQLSARLRSAWGLKKKHVASANTQRSLFHPDALLHALTMWKARKASVFTVIIDPGHGGKDPGARGLYGVQEKQVVLSIAKKLAQKINCEPGMRAVLTRTGDYYVSLHRRLQIAEQNHGKLFISIHSDAYFNGSVSGASVYVFSHHGASSKTAGWLAMRENDSISNAAFDLLGSADDPLRLMVLSKQKTGNKNSVRLAKKILQSLARVSQLHRRYVDRAQFLVLKSPQIPSVLVETGFISNPHEEARLITSQYQSAIAGALLQGVHQYAR